MIRCYKFAGFLNVFHSQYSQLQSPVCLSRKIFVTSVSKYPVKEPMSDLRRFLSDPIIDPPLARYREPRLARANKLSDPQTSSV